MNFERTADDYCFILFSTAYVLFSTISYYFILLYSLLRFGGKASLSPAVEIAVNNSSGSSSKILFFTATSTTAIYCLSSQNQHSKLLDFEKSAQHAEQ
jgi:hypothetical protein